jgi:signal transduction histidine kinase
VVSAPSNHRRSASDPETVQQACGIIERQSRQAARLLDDLLDVGRMTQGKIQLKNRAWTWLFSSKTRRTPFQTLVESRQHQLQLDLPPDSVWVHGDSASPSNSYRTC